MLKTCFYVPLFIFACIHKKFTSQYSNLLTLQLILCVIEMLRIFRLTTPTCFFIFNRLCYELMHIEINIQISLCFVRTFVPFASQISLGSDFTTLVVAIAVLSSFVFFASSSFYHSFFFFEFSIFRLILDDFDYSIVLSLIFVYSCYFSSPLTVCILDSKLCVYFWNLFSDFRRFFHDFIQFYKF